MENLADLNTAQLGGAPGPTRDELIEMQRGDYLIRVRDGEQTQVGVEKRVLPRDPAGHVQAVHLAMDGSGVCYAVQPTIFSRSEDGGRSWTAEEYTTAAEGATPWVPLDDGSFVCVSVTAGEGVTDPAVVWRSEDGGGSWRALARFAVEVPGGYHARYPSWGLQRLADGTLLWGIDVRTTTYTPLENSGGAGRYASGDNRLYYYRSVDGGESWMGPSLASFWGSEGGAVQLPSGRWLASVRYQRPVLPDDSAALAEHTGSTGPGMQYKHVFLVESEDQGETWSGHRQLTTVLGQCHGFPVALADGTVAVVHDCRYGPGEPSGRGMISRDEGRTWENETYYVYYGWAQSGYPRSVSLADDTVLTIAGYSDFEGGDPGNWNNWTGNSEIVAIRWRPGAEWG